MYLFLQKNYGRLFGYLAGLPTFWGSGDLTCLPTCLGSGDLAGLPTCWGPDSRGRDSQILSLIAAACEHPFQTK